MSRTALSTEFGISRDRVSKLVAEHASAA
jgi:hypothetical protein